MKSKIITDNGRIFLEDRHGRQHEITPVCIHCKKMDGTKKCDIDPKVVYCSGQCVVSCKNYKGPGQELDLFSSQGVEFT